jgi:hypothetical protein
MIELLKKFRDPQEVVQSAMTTLNKVNVTSSNPPPLFLCGHVKKIKKNKKLEDLDKQKSRIKSVYIYN